MSKFASKWSLTCMCTFYFTIIQKRGEDEIKDRLCPFWEIYKKRLQFHTSIDKNCNAVVFNWIISCEFSLEMHITV